VDAVFLRSRAQLRRHWRAWVALAVVFGIAAGTAMALAIASRRTEAAFPRFSDAKLGADVVVTGRSTYGLVGAVDLDLVEQTEYIESSARAFVAVPFTGKIDGRRPFGISDLFPVASVDGAVGESVEQWKILEGRAADPGRIDEATASFVLAERLDLDVGSTLEMQFYDGRNWPRTVGTLFEQWPIRIAERHNVASTLAAPADGPVVEVRITGIEASPLEFPPLLNDLAPILHLTPEFARRYQGEVVGSDIAYMRLARGHDLQSFQFAVERMAEGQPVSFVVTRENHSEKVQRSVHAEAVALAIVAGLVAFAGAVGVAQALTRQTFLEARDNRVLRSLGMRDSELRGVDLVRAVVVAGIGSAIAVVIAIFAPQYALLGLARKAELDGGAHVDVAVLASGVGIIMLLASVVALIASRAARRESRRDAMTRIADEHVRGPHVAGTAARDVPMVAAIGMRFAFQRGRAPRAAPAWTAIVGTALTVSMLAFAFTFVANLDRQLSEPSRYGWNWDVKLGQPNLPDLSSAFTPALQRDRHVSSVSQGVVTQIDIGEERVDVLGLKVIKGEARPTIVAGRAPEAADEIALGVRTMRTLDTDIDDFVNARIGFRNATLRVVGQAVFPEFGDAGQLGTGALMTEDGVLRLSPDAPRNTFLVAFRGDRDARAEERMLRAAIEPMPTRIDARPQDLVDLSRGNGLLGTLALMLAVLAFLMLVHVLATGVQSRRGDFAVLRTLGMRRAQVWATVGWHTATLVVTALLIGVPVGVLAGRATWSAFATRLGVFAEPITPVGPVALAVAGGLVVGLLAAIGPAWVASHSNLAEALHSSD
jgi:predicted lysophospholipase L1 biosynthesis ABC-type transport system permease subunit